MVARHAKRMFTLIELLTVVAIISLLISILTPSLSRARAQAKAAACGARMHDMGTSLTIYANDFGSQLPVAEYTSGGEAPKFGWAELMCKQNYGYQAPSDPNEPFPIQYNTNDVGRYCFYYFNCPGLGKEVDHTGHFRVYLPGWAYGSFSRDGQGRITTPADPTKTATIDAIPLQLPLLGDARRGVTGEASSYIAGGEAIAGEGTATFDDRHYGRVNLLYPDGHNELVVYDPDPNHASSFFVRLNKDWDLNGVSDDPNEPNTP
ncbi:MAG: type II secretion system protein [Phycisphaerae bacterium]|nr:type II secretion system protein [Phycisphaerae bacterium]